MDEKTKGLIQILFAILIAILVFLANDYIKEFASFGYLGVFVISVLSAATLFIPAPSWAIVISVSRVLDPYLVGIVAGIGTALGETTGYVAGQGASNLIKTNEHFKKWKEWIKKNDILAIGVLAFVPNPLFDVAGLAAGSLGIKLWRFILACAIGRIVRYILLAQLGAFSTYYL
ncbi:VTT domain-containing protein [Candidatus Micrarchaeota archaeon]|nr:VTT domain-containing protein [Candidatus Micrarchaeota archaeon]